MTTNLMFDLKNDDYIVWHGQVVMSRSEEPYFEKLFEFAAKKVTPARILEIGFGLGISAGLIQRHLRPSMHHIVEIDTTIGSDLTRFANRYPSVTAILGDWRHAQLDAPYDFIFYDPFDYFIDTELDGPSETQLLRGLLGANGILCHPHFGDGEPRNLSGFRSVVLERFEVPSITMADRTSCEHGALVFCYPCN